MVSHKVDIMYWNLDAKLSNKTYDFCTHWLDLDYMYVSHKNCTDQNDVIYVSMATKYPITKQRTFFKTGHSWPHIDLIKITDIERS